jgi:hypothetical protein
MDFDVLVITPLGNEAGALALFAIDQNAGARLADETPVIVLIEHDAPGHVPFIAIVPGVKAGLGVGTQCEHEQDRR